MRTGLYPTRHPAAPVLTSPLVRGNPTPLARISDGKPVRHPARARTPRAVLVQGGETILNASFLPESAGGPQLEAGEFHVWAVPLHGPPEPFEALLSAAEQMKAERLRFADHRCRFTIWRGALRAILGGYAGSEPRALEFTFGARGKPSLLGAPLQFNLSPSAQLALVAVGRNELGVDCEKVRDFEGLEDIARRHFSAVELAALSALAEPERPRGFYRCWTRKEAFIKAIGAGLSLPLDIFDVTIGDPAAFLAFRDGQEDPERWTLADVSPGPDYIAALAARERGLRV